MSDFIERFSARLVSLARTHDLIAGKDRGGAALRDLVESQIEAFVESDGRQVTVKGPPVLLDQAATQNIGLALHELATNAAKYGALSVPAGRVAIEWRPVSNSDGGRALNLSWRERNGPEVSEPSRKGFGHVVVERMIADSLNADVRLNFAPAGLEWEVEVPSAHFHLSAASFEDHPAHP
jgi:two-component sensor histidine kinase